MIATAALAVGIAAGSAGLVAGFAASRVHALDTTSRSAATNLSHLASAGALPQVLPVQAGQAAQVLDSDGAVVAASPGTLRTLPLLPLPAVRALADQGPADRTIDTIDASQLSRVLVLRTPVGGQPGYVVVAVSLGDEQDTVRGLTHLVLIGAPSLLAVVALTLWLLLGRALRAVTALRTSAESITDPAGGQRLPLPVSRDEMHRLATTLNAMLDRLAAASSRERSFIADAAHELRSPVAALQTQLEVAIATDGAGMEELTAGALEDARRLSALVEELLALARLDSGAAGPASVVDLADIAGVPGDGPAPVYGDPAMLSRAVGNLIANARRHARSRIAISVVRDADAVVLHVDDDGPGIPLADRERIFERFVRLDEARTRVDGGSGIGLAIVRATAESHGGSVTAGDGSLGGARFTMALPAAAAPEAPRSRSAAAVDT